MTLKPFPFTAFENMTDFIVRVGVNQEYYFHGPFLGGLTECKGLLSRLFLPLNQAENDEVPSTPPHPYRNPKTKLRKGELSGPLPIRSLFLSLFVWHRFRVQIS